MTAAKFTVKLTKYSLATLLLSAGLGIACGAQPANVPATQPSAAPSPSIAPSTVSPGASVYDPAAVSPQLQAAADRVTKARGDLDLAHKRLNASKAIVKTADAEFKAAKADQQALTLQSQAKELADASGMSETTPPAITAAPGQAAPTQSITNTDQSPDNAGQTFDFSGTPFTGVPTPGK